MPRKVFTAGEILTAADVNTNLMDQAVMVFDDSGARGSAIPSPSEGMVTYLKDTDSVEKYDGSSFVAVADPPAIVQVVSVNMNTTFSSASTSMTDISGLSATITPSSVSSKVFVIVSVLNSHDGSSTQAQFQLTDGSNNVLAPNSAPGSRTQGFASLLTGDAATAPNSGFTFLHSPATTSAFTYKIRGRTTAGTFFVNRSGNSINDANRLAGSSTITLMEVAG